MTMKNTTDTKLPAIPPVPEPFTYALPYSALQEIHALVGEVCGSHMNLPVRMIRKAHQVHSLMLDLKIIHPICTSANVEKKP